MSATFHRSSGRYDDPGWTATTPADSISFRRVARRQTDSRRARSPATRERRPPTVAALAKRMSDLAARAQRLSDEIEITNLQHAYGYYVDRKMWDDVADLFAADGTMEIGLQGVYAGRTSIRRGLNARLRSGQRLAGLRDWPKARSTITFTCRRS